MAVSLAVSTQYTNVTDGHRTTALAGHRTDNKTMMMMTTMMMNDEVYTV